jgi:UDP-glucose 4-epimerase
MKVMVTGGSGYIGAHTVLGLVERGDTVVVVDDLVSGSAARIPGVQIVRVDLAADSAVDVLTLALQEHEVDAVMHFAARKQVGESVERPAWYYRQNVGGLAQLLIAMETAGTQRLVFSSSAAVYGDASGAVTESHSTLPISPYGATKLAGEQLVAATTRAWPLSAASLRYFNVGGAGRADLGDTEAFNLIPMVLDRLVGGEAPRIFGDDYATPDGTCVRDYVHVTDVAEAHLAVLDSLPPEPGHRALNVGTGRGTSVREMIEALEAIAGIELTPVVEPRRSGDPDSVVAVVDRICESTGWSARLTLDDIVRSAWDSRSWFGDRAASSIG